MPQATSSATAGAQNDTYLAVKSGTIGCNAIRITVGSSSQVRATRTSDGPDDGTGRNNLDPGPPAGSALRASTRRRASMVTASTTSAQPAIANGQPPPNQRPLNSVSGASCCTTPRYAIW